MKQTVKQIVLIAIFFLTVLSATAQIRYGIKGGVNFANAKVGASALGISASAEYNFNNGLFIDARYNYGLVDNTKSFEFLGITLAKENYKNRVIQIGLGYKF